MTSCHECGAPLRPGTTCLDLLHELLVLEASVPRMAGREPHFFAVASYNLQHPSQFVPDALRGLRQTVADVLARRATVDDALRRARTGVNGATRVQRHEDTTLSDDDRAMLDAWPTIWPTTVRDVCATPPERYADAVRAWATWVIETLDAVGPDRDR